jgi:ABC-type dipeptide/oligopeptide/nickel transport system permease component
MIRYIIRRIVAMVPLLLIVTGFVFILGQYGATDLAMKITLQVNDGQFDAEVYEALQHQMGLDKPPLMRFVDFIFNAMRGDFGVSYVLPGNPKIDQLIINTLPVTLQLILAAEIILVLVGVPLGVIAAVTHNSTLDYLITTGTTVLSSTPPFVLAPLALALLVSELHILPGVGFGWHGFFSWQIILPAACLAAEPLLNVMRYTRASVLDVRAQEYIRAARARGLNEWLVISRHVVKNSMTPVLTWLGISVSRMLAAAIFIETVFGIRGFGDVAVTGFQGGDVQTVAAATLVTALIVMSTNLVADLLYGVLDPRVHLEA